MIFTQYLVSFTLQWYFWLRSWNYIFVHQLWLKRWFNIPLIFKHLFKFFNYLFFWKLGTDLLDCIFINEAFDFQRSPLLVNFNIVIQFNACLYSEVTDDLSIASFKQSRCSWYGFLEWFLQLAGYHLGQIKWVVFWRR